MLSVFRTNQLSYNILLLFYTILLRSTTYIYPDLRQNPVNEGGFYTNYLIETLGSGFWINEIFIVLLLFFQAVWINYMIYEFRLAKEVSLYPGVFYLLICSNGLWLLPLSGVIIGNTFLIFAISTLLKTYRVPSCADVIFNIGFWVAISSFFELSNIVFLGFAIFGLNFMRAIKLKEILIVLVGFFTPYLLVGVYFFYFDKLGLFVQSHFGEHLSLSLLTINNNLWINISVAFIGLLLAYHILSYGEYFKKKNIQVQKRISVFFLFFLTTFFGIFFQTNTDATNILVLAIPLAIFSGFAFVDFKQRTASSLHWIWLVLVIVLQLGPKIFG